MKKIVDKKIVDLYFKYDSDLTLLFEPWANKCDRDSVSSKQSSILGQYIEHLEFMKVNNMSEKLRDEIILKTKELEEYITQEVIDILKNTP